MKAGEREQHGVGQLDVPQAPLPFPLGHDPARSREGEQAQEEDAAVGVDRGDDNCFVIAKAPDARCTEDRRAVIVLWKISDGVRRATAAGGELVQPGPPELAARRPVVASEKGAHHVRRAISSHCRRRRDHLLRRELLIPVRLPVCMQGDELAFARAQEDGAIRPDCRSRGRGERPQPRDAHRAGTGRGGRDVDETGIGH